MDLNDSNIKFEKKIKFKILKFKILYFFEWFQCSSETLNSKLHLEL